MMAVCAPSATLFIAVSNALSTLLKDVCLASPSYTTKSFSSYLILAAGGSCVILKIPMISPYL